jgi:hypothetical protein
MPTHNKTPQSESVPTAEREANPTIDYYFDAAIHVVRRSKELAWASKELVVALLVLILLIQHSLHVLMK